MNIQRMQSILAGRGIRITPDDPIYALLAFNEVVLSEMTKQHLKTLQGGGQIVVPERLGVQHLQAALEKNGIAIQSNDPLFSFLLMNEDVLNESARKVRSAYTYKVAGFQPDATSRKYVGVMLAVGLFLIVIVAAVALLGNTTGLLIGVVSSALCGLAAGYALSGILRSESKIDDVRVKKNGYKQNWSEREFEVAAGKVKKSERTLGAVHDVLVMGVEIQEAAYKHKVNSLNLVNAVREIKGALTN